VARRALTALLLPPILLSSPPTRTGPTLRMRVRERREEVYERLVTARERELAAAAAWTERMRRWAARRERLVVLSPEAVQQVPSLLGIAPESRRPRPPCGLS
jgi:hypothetical protein